MMRQTSPALLPFTLSCASGSRENQRWRCRSFGETPGPGQGNLGMQQDATVLQHGLHNASYKVNHGTKHSVTSRCPRR